MVYLPCLEGVIEGEGVFDSICCDVKAVHTFSQERYLQLCVHAHVFVCLCARATCSGFLCISHLMGEQ